MTKQYTDKDIKSLKPLEAIRMRLSMYAGSSDNRALTHVVKELVANSLDELFAGYGSTIQVNYDSKTNTITIQDEGRGVPTGKIVEIFTVPHTGGKFDGKDKSYNSSAGLNGIGTKLATALGKTTVVSKRDELEYTQTFTHNSIDKPKIKKYKGKTGTTVSFTPDDNIPKIGKNNKIDMVQVEEFITELTYITPATFIISNNGDTRILKPKTAKQFIEDRYNSDLISPIFEYSSQQNGVKLNIAMAYNSNYEQYHSFVNTINTSDGGNHETSFKSTFTRNFNKHFQTEFSGTDLRKGIRLFLNLSIDADPVFSGQNKSKLEMPSISSVLNDLYKQAFEQFFKHKFFSELKDIIAKEAQKQKAMNKFRKQLTETINNKSKSTLLKKLKPAIDSQNLELIITEGDSAEGNLITRRNIYNQALLSLGGKPINSLSNPIEKILANTEIMDLIATLGNFENFNIAKCPYSKIIITADADFDGKHIVLLVLGFLLEFYPELVKQGRVYVANTPLFLIRTKGTIKYAFSNAELEKIKKQGLAKLDTISYVKGLGELDADTLCDCVVNEKTRNLTQLTTKDFDNSRKLLEKYIGADAGYRRENVNHNNNNLNYIT